jgi:hypothetical protein
MVGAAAVAAAGVWVAAGAVVGVAALLHAESASTATAARLSNLFI